MPVKAESVQVKKAKQRLGKLITECRGEMSLRQLANKIGLSPSNMKYIEDGVNCPTAEVYSKLIEALNPLPQKRNAMDQAYMLIRNAPPPDGCDRVRKDPNLLKAIRSMDDIPLTNAQTKQLCELLASFTTQNTKGEEKDGKNI